MSRMNADGGGYASLAQKLAHEKWINQLRHDAMSDDGLGKNYNPRGVGSPFAPLSSAQKKAGYRRAEDGSIVRPGFYRR